MARHIGIVDPEAYPPLPIEAGHWRAIVEAMKLSPQQATLVELVLRGMSNKKIADAMRIKETTVSTYLKRVSARTRTKGRMQLAMRVLAVSHQVPHDGGCHPK